MLSEQDLAQLLAQVGSEVDVPDSALVLAALTSTPEKPRLLARKPVKLLAVAAAVVALGVVALQALPDSVKDLRTETTASSGGSTAVGPVVPGTNGLTGSSAGALTSTDSAASLPVAAPLPLPQAARVPIAAGAAQAERKPVTVGPVTAPVGEDDGASRVVKTGTITLVAPDGKVSETVSKVEGFAARARGYVAGAQSTEYGDSPSATVTLRVPVDQFEVVVQQVRKVGAKVVSAETSGKDVTTTYADTEAQIASLKAARARFLTILSGANTIGETLTVQQRVDDVQGRIDRLEGQRRVLADQSSLATLTVTVGEKVELEGKVTSPSGLSTAWSDAKHGFTSGVEGLIARSGRALLVLLFGAVLLVVLRFGWRLARRRLV